MRFRSLAVAIVAMAASALLASSARALEVEIVDQSGEQDVYLTVAAGGEFDVPGMTNDQPVKLSSIPGGKLEVNKLVAGRIYISYGAGVTKDVAFTSPTRFHWAELTVTPSKFDAANLTGVDQFGIGMRLDTLDPAGEITGTLASANANTVFDALQEIPGGKAATVWDTAHKKILRVLSPIHTTAYPTLGDYVRSMSGTEITLRTAFYGDPFTTTNYTGTFEADGSITLSGTTNPPGQAPASFHVDGAQLIADIYTGENTPNTAQGAIYRDLLSAFSVGYWGGKYGNDALGFCKQPAVTPQGSWCVGFNQPAFGDARKNLSPYATCEQYAAVIDQYTDAYGNPYSDASKKVQLNLSQPGTGGDVSGLRLTILPDSGNSKPIAPGNPNCGAASLDGAFELDEQIEVQGGKASLGEISCPPACGRLHVTTTERGHATSSGQARGKRIIARGRQRARQPGTYEVRVKLTRLGKRRLSRPGPLKAHHTIKLRAGGAQIDRLRGRHRLRG